MDAITIEGRASSPVDETSKRERKKPERQPVLNRDAVDHRLGALRRFDKIVASLDEDPRAVQKWLHAAFAGCALKIDTLNAALVLGKAVDAIDYAMVVETLMQLSQRIGEPKQDAETR
jgi:hypothetical protein